MILAREDRMTKAIEKLTLQLQKTTEPQKQKGFFRTALSGGVAAAKANIGQALDPANLLESVAASRGGIMGAVLGSGAEWLRSKRTETDKRTKWAAGYLHGTEKGRTLLKEHGTKKAAQIANELYNKKTEMEKKVSSLEEKRSMFKASGVEGADLTQQELKEMSSIKKNLENLGRNAPVAKKKRTAKQEQKIAELKEQEEPRFFKAADLKKIDLSKISEEKEKTGPSKADISNFLYKKAVSEGVGKYGPGDEKQAEFMQAVKEGIEAELLDVSQEQLEMLKKLVSAATESEEDKREKEKKDVAQEVKTEAKEKLPGKNPMSLLDSLKDKIASLIPNLPGAGMLGRGLGKAAKGLGSLAMGVGRMAAPYALPALGVAAAGAAGYGAGTLMNKFVLNPAAEALTGEEGATVGTGLYKGVDKLKGWLGFETDEDKQKKADEASQLALGKQKLAAGEKISPQMAEFLKKNGVSVAASSIVTPGRPEPIREQQTAAVARREEAIQDAKKAAQEKPEQPNTVQQNTVVNSNKTVMNVRPDIRTNEPTYLKYSRQQFVF